MTLPENKIQYDNLTVNALPLELRRCQRCRALLLEGDEQEHADWHGHLLRNVQISGLGFGGLGVSNL